MPKKTDNNQGEIVKTLRAVGASVDSLHAVGKGIPDLLVGFRGVNFLLEVKTEQGKLTERQVKWHENWLGVAKVVRNPDEALQAIGATHAP